MYIWPFGRPRPSSTVTASAQSSRTQQYSLYSLLDPKMEKEKAYYLPQPAATPRSPSYRSRRYTRRVVAALIIAMIMVFDFQPLARLAQKTTQQPVDWEEATEPTLTTMYAQDVDSTHKELVPLEAHIMSKCPDAQDCLIDLIVPAMQRISDKVNFTLSFIGDINKDETVHCKHGEDECLGNMMMLCASKLYPDPKISLGFSTCLIKDYESIPSRELAQGCALEHAVSFSKLNDCMSEEGEGLELLKSSIQRSADKDVQYSCTVRLNDKLRCIRDSGEWIDCEGGSEPDDLVRDINALLK